MSKNPKNRLFLSCIHATELVEKNKITDLSIKERLQLFMHLSMCKACSEFKRLSNMMDNIFLVDSESENEEEIKKSQSSLEEKIKTLK